ncbi:hypothetical protein [Halobellus sp. EA9]|uniref:hypothetical protein n=1 Tax=Halobellus sp. EA9 TaxID=3421647 RepID=UPI003EC041C7
MGLKSGSRDAGLDESDGSDEKEDVVSAEPTEGNDDDVGSESQRESSSDHGDGEMDRSGEGTKTDSTDRPTMQSIPYKQRREKVNEGREQVPFFLRADVIEKESELQDTLEDSLGENVYKSDYREAAMVVAQRNPELVAEVLREWGYDLNSV